MTGSQRHGGRAELHERARTPPRSPVPHPRPMADVSPPGLLHLQRAVGNRAVGVLLRQPVAPTVGATPDLAALAEQIMERAQPRIEGQRPLEWSKRTARVVRGVVDNPRGIKDDPELRTALASLSRAQRRELTDLSLGMTREWVEAKQVELFAEVETAVQEALAGRFTELSEAATAGESPDLFPLSFKYLIRNGVLPLLSSPATKNRRGQQVQWSGVCGVGKDEAVFPALHTKELVAKLSQLPKKRRLGLEHGLTVAAFGWSSGAVAATGADPLQLEAEWNTLAGPVQENIEGGLAGYFSCRTGMLNAFGSPTNATASLEQANAYYTSLLRADFLKGSARGASTLVHPDLKAALDGAEQLMTARGWREGVGQSVRQYWSTSIRENRNSVRRLSDHSFGWAVDINAHNNPNITSKDDKAFIQEILGADVFTVRGTKQKSPLAQQVIAGTDTDDIRKAATKIGAASDNFRLIFANPVLLRIRLIMLLRERGMKTDIPTTLRLLDVAAKATVDLAGDKKARKGGAAQREAFRAELGEILQAASPGLAPKKVKAVASAATDLVMRAFDVERRAADPSAVDPGAGLHQMAVHGFANLDPRLVAALVSPEGGNLKWLGVHNQDMHHFELKREPTLPKASAVAT